MARSIPNVKFELNAVYKTYADQLFLAGNISNLLLDSANINAAGGQVEVSTPPKFAHYQLEKNL